MKKIGIFSDDFYPIFGGQGRHLFDLYNNLYKKNNEFLIFSPNNNSLKNHIKITIPSNFGRNLFFSKYLNKNINNLIKEFNLSVVHFHCGPGGLILLKKPNAKMVCTVHHTYYQQQKYIKSQRWKYLFYLLEKLMYRNADKLISVSEDTKNVLIKKYTISPKKIVVIPNGVDFNKFKKIKSIKKIPNSLLFVGRLDKRKGIDFLVKLIPFIAKEIPDIKLFIIGKGKLRDNLEKFVKKNNLEKNIEFLGFIPDEDLPKWYNKCNLTVVPSIFEGFGITVIESLACGTPVIGTDTDGIRGIIKDKKYLFRFGNKEELSNKIIQNIKNSISINFDKRKYSLDEIAKKTLESYK